MKSASLPRFLRKSFDNGLVATDSVLLPFFLIFTKDFLKEGSGTLYTFAAILSYERQSLFCTSFDSLNLMYLAVDYLLNMTLDSMSVFLRLNLSVSRLTRL